MCLDSNHCELINFIRENRSFLEFNHVNGLIHEVKIKIHKSDKWFYYPVKIIDNEIYSICQKHSPDGKV